MDKVVGDRVCEDKEAGDKEVEGVAKGLEDVGEEAGDVGEEAEDVGEEAGNLRGINTNITTKHKYHTIVLTIIIQHPMEYRCKNSASPPIHRIKWAQCAIAIAIVHLGDISTLLHGHSHFFDSSANKSVCKTSNGGQMDDGY